MSSIQPPARPTSRLRAFVAWSLILHAGAGIAWGLPAWLRMQAERELEQSLKAWAENLVKEGAKARAHAQEQHTEATRREVEAQLRQQFDKLTSEMAEKARDKVWSEVSARLEEKTRALANALVSSTITEQDLRNLEAQLQRDLVDQTDQILTAETAQEMAERFVEQVDGQVAPELAKWMREQVRERVAKRLREDADHLVREQRDGARQQRESGRQAVQAAGQKLQEADTTAHRDRQDATASGKRFTEAGQKLAEADKQLATAQERTPDVGSSTRRQLEGARQAVRQAQEAVGTAAQQATPEVRAQAVAAADQAIAAARQATQAAGDALGKTEEREQYARQDLKQLGEGALKDSVEQAFAQEFRAETVPRLTPKLAKAFKEQLEQSGLKNDRLVDEVAKRAGELLAAKVPTLAQAGEPVEDRFHDLAPESASGSAPAAPMLPTGPKSIDVGLAAKETGSVGAAGQQQAAAKPMADAAKDAGAEQPSALDQKLDAGKAKMTANAKGNLGQIAKDGSHDNAVVQGAMGATGSAGDAALADMRDRISRLAEGMRKGRMGDMGAGAGAGIGSLRQRALGRMGSGQGASSHRNEAAYRELTKQIADRGLVQGASWERTGATGSTSRAESPADAGPAWAAGRDNRQAKMVTGSTEPYQPSFKSLAFTSVPCLPGTFVIDGQPGKWEGIPGVTLKPEKGNDPSVQTMQLGWRSDGLFCRFTVTDPDHKITKTTIGRFSVADVVEVWIDSLNSKEKYRARHAGQQFWIWPDGSNDDPGLAGGESVKATRNSGYRFHGIRLPELPRATVMTAQGYSMEFQLPAALIRDADLAPGRILGFNSYVTTMSGTDWYWSAGKQVETFGQPDTWGDILLAGSDAAISLADRPAAQSAAPAVLIPGQPLKLSVADGDMNLSPLRRDKVMVTLKPTHGGQQIAVLEESGEATGVFTGSVTTALALDEDQPGTLSVYEGETVVVSYIDQARANGSRNVEVKLSLRFGSALALRVVAK